MPRLIPRLWSANDVCEGPTCSPDGLLQLLTDSHSRELQSAGLGFFRIPSANNFGGEEKIPLDTVNFFQSCDF